MTFTRTPFTSVGMLDLSGALLPLAKVAVPVVDDAAGLPVLLVDSASVSFLDLLLL